MCTKDAKAKAVLSDDPESSRSETRIARVCFNLMRAITEKLESRQLLAAGTGLLAQYFDNADFTNLKMTRTDAQVNFNWASGAPTASMGVDTFSVRWTGQIAAQSTEKYTFYTSTD